MILSQGNGVEWRTRDSMAMACTPAKPMPDDFDRSYCLQRTDGDIRP